MLRVAVVGAGIGGLALAQGLVGADGIEVRVFERDPHRQHRRQGYRIHIDAIGERALAETLPIATHRRVVATASRPSDFVGFYDAQMSPLAEQVFPDVSPEAVNAVDRQAFRGALMTGLDDVLHFGHELADFDDPADGPIELRFADGETTQADVLIGADGVSSRIRQRLLPEFTIVDTGVRCIYAKLPLTDEIRHRVPVPFLRGFCFVADHSGHGAAFGPVVPRDPVDGGGDYLMTVFTALSDVLKQSDTELFALPPADLWRIAVEATGGWHPSVRDVLLSADVGSAFPIVLRSCLRIDPWPSGRVTLLGDAIHPMSPAAGAGANTALRDAALLSTALREASGRGVGTAPADRRSLVDAVARYEGEMITHAEAVVSESLARSQQLFGRPVAGVVA